MREKENKEGGEEKGVGVDLQNQQLTGVRMFMGGVVLSDWSSDTNCDLYNSLILKLCRNAKQK